MKRTLVLLLFFFSPLIYSPAQQIQLTGQVSIHNSQYETGAIAYVKDAFVNAPFGGSVNTDNEGKFELTFIGIASGTSVSVKVKKSGLEIVNKRELMDVVVGRRLPLRIFLAPIGQLAKAQTELYNVSLEALTKRHRTTIAKLRADEAIRNQTIAELENKLNQEIADRFQAEDLLNRQLQRTKQRLPEFAKELARVNLDFASEMYQQAYEYFKAGEIEKAIETLDEAILDKQAEEAVKNIDHFKEDLKNLDTARIYQQQEILQLLSNYHLQAKAFFQEGQPAAAVDTLLKAMEIGATIQQRQRTVLDEFRDLAWICSINRDYESAFFLLQKGLFEIFPELEEPLPDQGGNSEEYIRQVRLVLQQLKSRKTNLKLYKQ